MIPTDATADRPAPPACVVAAIPAADRAGHGALVRRLFGDGAGRRPVRGGYEYRLDAGAFDDVARFVATERRCCPFLTFALEVAAEGGPLRLRLTGPPGTRALLDAELHRRA